MSSAILYLAIVAIWACVLVPRWLHRAHDNPAEQENSPGEENSPGPEESADRPEAADRTEAGGPEELADAGEPTGATPEFATLREQVVEAEAHVAWEDHAASADPAASEGAVASARFAAVSYSVTEVSVSSAGRGGPDGPAIHDEPAPQADRATASGDDRDRGRQPGRSGRSRPQDAAPGRAHVLRARRRMLTMLVTLAIATAGSTFVGLTAWWVIIPPAGLLGVYLLLLREAAHADIEIARGRAEARARVVTAAHERARLARAAAAQPTAEIIDISALAIQAGDQPYDQYADAEVRAVGD